MRLRQTSEVVPAKIWIS